MAGANLRTRASRGWLLVQLLDLAAGLTAAAALSKAAVARFWTFSAATPPERFPWGPVTESGARTFEEVMGFLVLELLICPLVNAVVLPAMWQRMGRGA